MWTLWSWSKIWSRICLCLAIFNSYRFYEIGPRTSWTKRYWWSSCYNYRGLEFESHPTNMPQEGHWVYSANTNRCKGITNIKRYVNYFLLFLRSRSFLRQQLGRTHGVQGGIAKPFPVVLMCTWSYWRSHSATKRHWSNHSESRLFEGRKLLDDIPFSEIKKDVINAILIAAFN